MTNRKTAARAEIAIAPKIKMLLKRPSFSRCIIVASHGIALIRRKQITPIHRKNSAEQQENVRLLLHSAYSAQSWNTEGYALFCLVRPRSLALWRVHAPRAHWCRACRAAAACFVTFAVPGSASAVLALPTGVAR
jgi:hypothetical protein